MKSKLNYLTNLSLNRKIKTKWFLIANIILALVIIGISNIDTFINLFGGDFNEKQIIYVVDNTSSNAYTVFENQMIESKTEDYEVKKYDKDLESLKEKVNEKETENMIVVFNDNLELVLDATIITKEYMDIMDITTKISKPIIKDFEVKRSELTESYNKVQKQLDDVKFSMMTADAGSKIKYRQQFYCKE